MLNTAKSAERSRLDAAHELAHLVLHRHEMLTASKEVEREAQRFGSALLMPEAAIRSMAPRNIDLQSLIALKHYWGVSAVAVAFRLHQLRLMSDWNYRWLFREMSVRGWRSQEPEPMERERSQVIAKVFMTLAEEGIARGQVASELAVPFAEIESLSFGLASITSDQRDMSNSVAGGERPSLRLVPPTAG
jgi:Zn-dependent peptidase ImmA (M78 family)